MKALFIIFSIFVFISCGNTAMFTKSSDRNDWSLGLGYQEYAQHQNNMVDLDVKRAEADTQIYIEKQLQKAIKKGDEKEIEKWKRIKEKNAPTSPTNKGEGLVFSIDPRYVLKIYKSGEANAIRTFTFDRNQKQYASLPDGRYDSRWILPGEKSVAGWSFEVKKEKTVYHDGQILPWYCGWQ